MKKVLVRAGMSPLDTFSADEMIKRNAIGNNVGNLMYAYSVFRNLTTENVELTADYYRADPADADMINETYDSYVIPLANAIRPSFIPTLKRYTALIEKLKIPVFVVGMGMAFPYEPNVKQERPFDNDVKHFVSAVLEKSNILGLRGQITSDYLSYLGFKEGRDHMVIGCPSMYTFGDNIKIRDTELNNNSAISINMTPTADQKVLKFLNDLSGQYKNLEFTPQDLDEMILTYSGTPSLGAAINSKVSNYPNSLNSAVYKNNQVKFFLSAPSWIDHMGTIDLSIGTRLHGNVAPILAGTPSIAIPIDARMRELTEYHNFPRVPVNEIREDMKLEELLGKVDVHSVEKNQKRNYDNFINFLDKNGIENVYHYNSKGLKTPFDGKLEQVNLKEPLIPITSCDAEEMTERLQKNFDIIVTKQEKEKNNNGKKLKVKTKAVSKLKNDLNEKSKELNEKNEAASKLKNDLEKKTEELNEKNRQNEELTLKVQTMENSKSWKLTKPLRNFGQK
ncbi:polysaccharide pyruvyl transferase family protein [Tetragenococcus koreensis]|uniref:Polysaccharide pyruvyl transferase domain-containing protein n=1 Tax=Tetragenococcus koreensis TaxID=290335 RepID=A0AAN4UBM6_9ENTE|nr:polysaccharide pyruvyl transferase family protein [Tetragenococcus koreensis]MDN6641455.1 polysaccharide pyruvyl transferase family protein [Tetragenococcus sp.]MDN6731663.1 polysaccharide pyruvyl transferase family protein [Atopostipes suicloacalis]MDN6840505.1 polysaccharide pyruvyl transferase family protein [Tetragenococcus halophilus]AYW45234.1 polysaccharide pyruvyl transferase [Tetragenococcus koreensis]MCF1615766.1 polysaccharide pyruvyl transferase family protein [Tetragenococcus k